MLINEKSTTSTIAISDVISPVVVVTTPTAVVPTTLTPTASQPSSTPSIHPSPLKAAQLEFNYVQEDGIYYSNSKPSTNPPCQSCNLYHKSTDEAFKKAKCFRCAKNINISHVYNTGMSTWCCFHRNSGDKMTSASLCKSCWNTTLDSNSSTLYFTNLAK